MVRILRLFVLIVLPVGLNSAFAERSDLIRFKSVYPHIIVTRLDSCAVCHVSPVPSDGALNVYGADYKNAGSSELALVDIEQLDSDGDLISNVIEIERLTFPGDSSDFPILTATPTDTPNNETPTIAPSDTPTDTMTATPTRTPSHTPTHTLTYTPTATASHTPTNTLTHTATLTCSCTPTPSATPTNTQTETPSETPTSTPPPQSRFDFNTDGSIDSLDLLLLMQRPDAGELLFEFLLYWGL
ncbi:MAG TPA: hypothetical protein PKH07_04320 [bacterium]|nr:hypothetical protein [bacterium]